MGSGRKMGRWGFPEKRKLGHRHRQQTAASSEADCSKHDSLVKVLGAFSSRQGQKKGVTLLGEGVIRVTLGKANWPGWGLGGKQGRRLESGIQVSTGRGGREGNQKTDLRAWDRQAASRGADLCEGEQTRP